MELTTGRLSSADYARAVEALIAFLGGMNVTEVIVAYGFGCDCPDEQLYEDRRLPLAELMSFISTSEQQDYYRLGKDNLHIWDAARTTEILLGHEAYILVVSEDAERLAQLANRWREAEIVGVNCR